MDAARAGEGSVMAAPKIAKSAPMARKPPVAAFSFMTHDRFMIAPSPLNLPVTRLARGFGIALRHERRLGTHYHNLDNEQHRCRPFSCQAMCHARKPVPSSTK